MTARDMALKLIKRFEGCRLKAYQDDVGVWTVGYGCTSRDTGLDIGPNTVWTKDQANAELEKLVDCFMADISGGLTHQVTDMQFAALVSLCFNIGTKAFLGSSLLRQVNAGNMRKAAESFRSWVYAGGQVHQGLVKRREQERAVFLGTGAV